MLLKLFYRIVSYRIVGELYVVLINRRQGCGCGYCSDEL